MCRLQKSTEHAWQCPSPIHTRAWSMTIAHHCRVFTIHSTAGHVVMYLQQYGPSYEPCHQQYLALSKRARPPMQLLITDSESWHSCGHFAPMFKVIGQVWSRTARLTCKVCTVGVLQAKPVCVAISCWRAVVGVACVNLACCLLYGKGWGLPFTQRISVIHAVARIARVCV